jgi:hypothetical protein
MINSKDKCVIAFNRFLADFIRDINRASRTLKSKNKAGYRLIESCSPRYLEAFCERTPPTLWALLETPQDDVFDAVRNLEVIDGLTYTQIADEIGEDNLQLKEFVLLFLTISRVATASPDQIDAILAIVAQVQDGEDVSKVDLKDSGAVIAALVHELAKCHRLNKERQEDDEEEVDEEDGKPKMPFDINSDIISNSTIGKIAKEVAEELEGSNIGKINSIDDVFKTTNGTNVIGDIVTKLGEKLQSKIANGKVNQQDLIKEAFGMFGPFMGDMMKHMPNNPTKRTMSTRDRLKKKLSERS